MSDDLWTVLKLDAVIITALDFSALFIFERKLNAKNTLYKKKNLFIHKKTKGFKMFNSLNS